MTKLHKLLFSAIGANDVVLVRDETVTDQAGAATSAEETIVVPVTVLEGDELSSSDSGDGLVTSEASFGKQFTETIGAIRFLVTASKTFPSKAFFAMRASEAFAMPWLILVGYSSTGDYLTAFDTSRSVFVLVALGTVDFLFARNKALRANRNFTYTATETLFVPLSCFVFHFFRSCFEALMTSIAPRGELLVIATNAVNAISLGTKLSVYQRFTAGGAQKACFVPVLVLV